jgi:hypothetical protein
MTDVDLNVHRPSPPADEPPYRRTCLRCGSAWPCPSRRDDIRAEQAEIIAAVRSQASDDARRVGVLSLIEPGVSVWSSTRVDAFEQPLGGVVVHIEDDVDRETGEVSRWFTCLSLGYGPTVAVRRIAEAEVLQTGVQATDNSTLTKLVKKLAGEVHDAKGSYLDLRAFERVRWQYVLTGVANLAA